MSSPYGYWTFGVSNGLVGGPSEIIKLPDGRKTIVKDALLPAILEEEFIVFALKTSSVARAQFNMLFPSLDPVSQDRLRGIIYRNGYLKAMLNNPYIFDKFQSPQDQADEIQLQDVTSGIHLEIPIPHKEN